MTQDQTNYYDESTRALFEERGWEWPDPDGWDPRDGQPHHDALVSIRGPDRVRAQFAQPARQTEVA